MNENIKESLKKAYISLKKDQYDSTTPEYPISRQNVKSDREITLNHNKAIEMVTDNSAVVVIREPNGVLHTGYVYADGMKVTNVKHELKDIESELTCELIDSMSEDIKFSEEIINQKPERGEIEMKELVKEAVRTGKTFGLIGNETFEVKDFKGFKTTKKVRLGNKFFTVTGNVRLKVVSSTEAVFLDEVVKSVDEVDHTPVIESVKKKRSEAKADYSDKTCVKCGKNFEVSKFNPKIEECSNCKPRRSKNPKPARIDKTCVKCGKNFETSKFTPNVTECPDCRPRRSGAPKEVEPRKCKVTGEMFTPSKFNPNAQISPEGKKLLADQQKRESRLEDAFAIARGNEKLDSYASDQIKDSLAKAWDFNEVRSIPSLLKAVREDLMPKPKKEVKAYEASDEEQEEILRNR